MGQMGVIRCWRGVQQDGDGNQVQGTWSSEPGRWLLPSLKEARVTRGLGLLFMLGGTKSGCAPRLTCWETRRLKADTPGNREALRQETGMGHKARSSCYWICHTCCPEEERTQILSYLLPFPEGPRTASIDNADSCPTVRA